MAKRSGIMKGSTDPLILGLIAHQPMYGYQVLKELEKRTEGYFKFKEGTLYPVLHRLERTGLLESKWQVLPNGRQRKYYHITAKGLSVYAEQKNQWLSFLKAMNLILSPVTT